jgi:hypothetical protein
VVEHYAGIIKYVSIISHVVKYSIHMIVIAHRTPERKVIYAGEMLKTKRNDDRMRNDLWIKIEFELNRVHEYV